MRQVSSIGLALLATCCLTRPLSAAQDASSPANRTTTSTSSSAASSSAALAAPVQSDGCTWWFDGDHKACCVQHDVELSLASTWRDRLRADQRFCACIWRTPGWWHKPLAPVMWAGVNVLHRGVRPVLGVLHLRRSRSR